MSFTTNSKLFTKARASRCTIRSRFVQGPWRTVTQSAVNHFLNTGLRLEVPKKILFILKDTFRSFAISHLIFHKASSSQSRLSCTVAGTLTETISLRNSTRFTPPSNSTPSDLILSWRISPAWRTGAGFKYMLRILCTWHTCYVHRAHRIKWLRRLVAKLLTWLRISYLRHLV